MSPRPPPKISWRHDWTKELGSKVDRQPREEVAQQPRWEVFRQAKFFQPNPKTNLWSIRATWYQIRSVFIKAKHFGLERSRRHLLAKNSVLRIDQGNLISRIAWLELRQICLEKSELSKLTIEQGNLINMKSHYEQPLKYIVRLRRSTSILS